MKKISTIAVISIIIISFITNIPTSIGKINSCSVEYDIFVDDDFNETTSGWNITHFCKIQKAINNAFRNVW